MHNSKKRSKLPSLFNLFQKNKGEKDEKDDEVITKPPLESEINEAHYDVDDVGWYQGKIKDPPNVISPKYEINTKKIEDRIPTDDFTPITKKETHKEKIKVELD